MAGSGPGHDGSGGIAGEWAVSGFKIELVTKRAEVERWSAALDALAIAIAAFEIVPGGDWRLEAYTLEPPDPDIVRAALLQAAEGARVALPAYHIAPLPPVDWLAENQRDTRALGG